MNKLLERRRELDEALTDVLGNTTPEQRFSLFTKVNKSKALEDGADMEEITRRCFIAAEDIYDHYDVASEYDTFFEFFAEELFDEEDVEAFIESRTE
jgi:hypothetical protein